MNYFAKFEKFLPHRIIIPSFMTVGSQMPELDGGGGGGGGVAPYKLRSQNIPYKLGLMIYSPLKNEHCHYIPVCDVVKIRVYNLAALFSK